MLKRKLAALLAGAMVLTSLPMVSFAKTDNEIDRKPQVSDDYKFDSLSKNPPILTITEDDATEFRGDQTFRLSLKNAEFFTGEDLEWSAGDDVTSFVYMERYINSVADSDIVEISRVNKTTAEITWSAGNDEDKEELEIPLFVKLTDEGEAVVEIEPRDSQISADSLVFAVSATGNTIAEIDSVETISDSGDIAAITIDETKIGAIGNDSDQEITLKLPTNFSWREDADDNEIVRFSGGLKDSHLDSVVANGRELTIKFDPVVNRTTRGTITIDEVSIVANSKAKFGDVDVRITGDEISTQTLTVAKYVDYGISIKADGDPKELLAGRWENDAEDEVFELQKLVIKEDIENSWLAERKTKVEFPEGVKIVGFDIKKAEKLDGIEKGFAKTTTEASDLGVTLDKDRQYIEFSADEVDGKAEFEIVFYVSVEANFTGEIVATVSGRSIIEEEEVVLGEAIAPITATVDVKDVRIGRQNEELGTITITESQAEAIKTGDLKVTLDSYFEWNNTPDVEVTEGDIEIKSVKVDDNELIIKVEGESREASTIEITGAKADLNRVIPEGEFKLEIGGSSIVENDEEDIDTSDTDESEDAKFETTYVVKTVFANVVTPNVDDLAKGAVSGQKASFTVGSADYTVGEEVATADAAPYIKDGRTMIPVKYAAFALGVDPSNIKWDQATKTATILGDRVIQVKIGSKDLVVNGAVLTMDTAAEVTDGRTFLPISWVASALNVPYSFDDATKTVTFN